MRKGELATPVDRLRAALSSGGRTADPAEIVLWAGKPPKPHKRFYAYQKTTDGRLWLAKVAAERDALLENEASALVWLAGQLKATDLAGTIPNVLVGNDEMIVVEWVSTRSLLDVQLRARRWPWARGRLAARSGAVVRWLARFHQLTAERAGIGGVHGDLRPANVLIEGQNHLMVVDWELSAAEGTQVFDLLHFATHVGLGCVGGNIAHGMEQALVKQTWISELVNALMRIYFNQVGKRPGDLIAVYQEFLQFLRDRRQGLGLTSEDHFVWELQRLMEKATEPPYALRV